MTKTKKDRIISYVKWRINTGIYEPSKKIPSENAIAIKFNCSRLTARSALQVLKDEKFIVSRKGKGYFVSLGRDKRTFLSVNNLGEHMHKFQVVNLKPTKLIRDKLEKLNIDIKDISKDFGFNFIKTSFDKKEKPYTALISYVNTKLVGQVDVDEIKMSFSTFLNKRSVSISERQEITFIEPASDIVRIRLNMPKNSLVSATYSVMFDENGQIIEYAIRYVIPKEFVMKKSTFY